MINSSILEKRGVLIKYCKIQKASTLIIRNSRCSEKCDRPMYI